MQSQKGFGVPMQEAYMSASRPQHMMPVVEIRFEFEQKLFVGHVETLETRRIDDARYQRRDMHASNAFQPQMKHHAPKCAFSRNRPRAASNFGVQELRSFS